MARQSGLTLIEMLVAMVIMSAVMMLSAEAYRFYIERSQAGSEQLEQQFQTMRTTIALQDQLSAAFHYYMPNSSGPMALAFDGHSEQLTWVATTSMQRQELAAVSWLGVIDSQLMYCEILLSEQLIMSLPEPSELCQSFQLVLSEVDEIKLQYYGWPGVVERLELGRGGFMPVQQAWYSRFSGVQNRVLPDAIQLSYVAKGTEHTLFANLPNMDPGRASNAISE